MASKSQCELCKGYNSATDLCTIKWMQPTFDGKDCEAFPTANNPKEQKTEIIETNANEERFHKSRIGKRGKSFNTKTIHGLGEKESLVIETNKDDSSSNFVLEIKESTLRVLTIILFAVFVCGIGYASYTYIEHQREQERNDIVWKARTELESLRSEKKVSYFRISDIKYEKQLLSLSCIRGFSNFDTQLSDTALYSELLSYIAYAPNLWKNIAKYLTEADTDLKIIYTNINMKPNITITHEELSTQFLSEDALQAGLKMFSHIKGIEVVNYARMHFAKDRFFTVDSLSFEPAFISLHLSYNDSIAKLGKSFLQDKWINPHYTDLVGEMGSILDGMLVICTRINKGIAFVYTGKKSNKVDRVEWDAEKTMEIAKKNNDRIYFKEPKKNQVRTVINRQK